MIDTNKMRNHIGDALVTPGLTILALLDEIDRLRKRIAFDECNAIRDAAAASRDMDEIRPASPVQGKTVKVKVPCAVDINGKVAHSGENYRWLNQNYVEYYLTATLPVPVEVEVVAKVEGE